MGFDQSITKGIRKAFPQGQRVKLVRMKDPQAPPIGTEGVVRFVDDIGTVHISWANGSTLGVCLEEDIIKRL